MMQFDTQNRHRLWFKQKHAFRKALVGNKNTVWNAVFIMGLEQIKRFSSLNASSRAVSAVHAEENTSRALRTHARGVMPLVHRTQST